MNPQKTANCKVLGDGSNPADSAHVSKSTPLDLKRREFKETTRYRTNLNAGFNETRQASTSEARQHGKVRPLGGK